MKFFLFVGLAFLLPPAIARTCIPPRRTTPETCVNPPVIRRVNLPAYTGRWFNMYVSGSATEFALDCVTANYTLNLDNTIQVLNCNYNSGQERPSCLRGVASRRPDLPSSRLQVSFGTDMPPGAYNVAALLGKKNYGYFAAAIYTCRLVRGVPEEGMFIISRAPFAPVFVLQKLKERLRCMGYFLLDNTFEQIKHSRMCQYFDGGNGFDTFGPSASAFMPTSRYSVIP